MSADSDYHDQVAFYKKKCEELEKKNTLLSKDNNKFKSIANNSYDWSYWLRPDKTLEFVSKSCMMITGYSDIDFYKNPELIHDIVIAEDKEKWSNHREHSFRGEYENPEFVFRILTKNNEVKWIGHTCKPVFDSDRQYLGRQSINRDISARMLYEEALMQSEENFRAIAENSPDAIYECDENARITRVNKKACEMTGFSEEQLIGMNVFDIDSIHRTPKQMADFIENLKSIRKTILISEHIRQDGSKVPVEINISLYETPAGIRIIGTVRDITSRLKAEQKQMLANNKFKILSDNVPGIVFQIEKDKDGNSRYTYISDSVKDYFGFGPEDVYQDSSLISKVNSPGHSGIVKEGMLESEKNLTPFVCEHQKKTKNGNYIWMLTRSIPERMPDGRTIWTGISINIDDSIKDKEELKRSEEKHRLLFENAGLGIGYYTKDAKIIAFNKIAAANLNGSPGDFTGKTLREVFGEEEGKKYEKRIRIAVENDGIKDYEDKITVDGKDYYYLSSICSVRGFNNKVIGAQIISKDITDRKLSEKKVTAALKKAKEKQKEISLLLKASKAIPVAKSFEEAAKTLFDICCELIGAKSGYVAMLSDDGAENEVLFLEAGGLPCTVNPELPMPIRGLRETAYRTNSVAYENDFANSKWEKYMPEGHVYLRNVMFAPLVIDDKSVGLLGMANKDGDFTERDAEIAGAFGDLAAMSLTFVRNRDRLARSRHRYKKIIENMKSGVAVYKPVNNTKDFKFTGFNKKAEEITNSRYEDVIGKTLLELFPNMGEAPLFKALQEVYESGRDKKLEPFFYKDAIREGWRENYIYKLPTGEIVAIFDDVTDIIEYRKQLEERNSKLSEAYKRIEESEIYYRTLIENSTDVISMLDAEGNIIYESPSHQSVLGYDTGELMGKNAFDYVHPDDQKGLLAQFNGLLNRPGGIENLLFRYLNKSGEYRYLEGTGKNLLHMPELQGIVVNYYDVTEKKQTEAELEKLAKIESLGIVAGGIAHNFKNLMTAMSLSVELAKMKPHRVAHHLDKISKTIEQATALATKFQTFTKSDAPIMRSSDINKIIRDSSEMAITGSSIVIEYDLDPDLSDILIDDKQIHEVITNLILNAKHSMSKGGKITITTKQMVSDNLFAKDKSNDQYISIDIIDEGMGIPKSIIDKIFNPFFTTKENGHGLGLASALSIIEKHKGTIKVDSKVGIGTTFTILLPYNKSISGKSAVSSGNNGDHISTKILILDDNEEILENMKELSDEFDIDLVCANTPEKVRKIYSENPDDFNLVILDLTLRGYSVDGSDVLCDLKKINPEIKALVFSGHSNKPIVANYEKYGFVGRIDKPLVLPQFLNEIKRVLDKQD